MKVAEVGEGGLREYLAQPGLALDFGAARARIRTDLPALAAALGSVYSNFDVEPAEGFFDVTASVRRARGLRRVLRPQIQFVADGALPFEPFPAATHLPFLEWGLNWSIAERCNQHLLLHAGVVALGDAAVVLPALPGSGKSTLTAALAVSGFRLLSDEFGVVRLADSLLLPMVRPVALKNASIGVLRALAPAATIGPVFAGTRKGDVAHLAPDAASFASRHAPARARLVVFPRYATGSATRLEPLARSRAFAKLSANSFNYEVLGADAFDAVARLIEACDCYRLEYSRLPEAIAEVERLARRAPSA